MAAAARELDVLRTRVPLVLAHKDYGADHILVADGGVTAILDWERTGLADPAQDVAWCVLYDTSFGGGASAVRDGYGAGYPTFDERVRAWVFAGCLSAVDFLIDQGHLDGAAGMVARTGQLLVVR